MSEVTKVPAGAASGGKKAKEALKEAKAVAKENTKVQTDAEKAAKAAKEAAEKAEKDAAKAQAKVAREKAAAAKKAEVEKRAKEAERILAPKAKEIVARMESAAKSDAKADEHRLACAIILKDAEATCKEMGQNFKAWCEKNLGEIKGASGRAIGYETIRKLVAVGKSDNPPQALQDLREKNKVANQNARKKAKGGEAAAAAKKAIAERKPDEPAPLLVVKDAVMALGEADAEKVVADAASELGKVLVSKEQAKVVSDGAIAGTLDNAKLVFKGLKTADRVAFVTWAASEIGMVASMPSFDKGSEPDLPAALKR